MHETATTVNAAKPKKGVATLLALFGPWGIGHFYLGRKKRAVLWLVLASSFVVLCAAGLPWLGGVLGYGRSAGVVCAGAFAAWVGSLVDLRRVPESRLERVGGFRVLGYWVVGLVCALGVRSLVRAVLLEAFLISSGAMQPALLVGDRIVADKLVLHGRHPKRGEVVVFEHPEQPKQHFVERVVAIAGDTLEVRGGHPWLNGSEVPHCLVGKTTMPDAEGGVSSGELFVEYLGDEAYLVFLDERTVSSDTHGPYTVEEGEVWVLGDNRYSSYDSRFWFGGRGGGLPLGRLKGRALFRWLGSPSPGFDGGRFGTAVAEPLLPGWMKEREGALEECLAQRPSPAAAAASRAR